MTILRPASNHVRALAVSLCLGLLIIALGSCSRAAKSVAHTDMSWAAHPDARLHRVLTEVCEDDFVSLTLVSALPGDRASASQWFEESYGGIAGVNAIDVNQMQHPVPYTMVRYVGDSREGLELPITCPIVKIRSPLRDEMKIGAWPYPAPTPAPEEDDQTETELVIWGAFPVPDSARRSSVGRPEQERLIALWERRQDDILAWEMALDVAVQSPDAHLVDALIGDGLAPGWLSVDLSFATSASHDEVVSHFESVLAPLGLVRRMGSDGDTFSLAREWGPPATLTVQTQPDAVPTEEPGESGAGAPVTVYTWHLPRIAVWVPWAAA